MNDCRIVYDKHFTARCDIDLPLYKGRKIDGVSLYFQYRYFSKDNKNLEILFPENGFNTPECFYTCSYDRENGYTMALRENLLVFYGYSKVDYTPDIAVVYYANSDEIKVIPFEEAVNILKKNVDSFGYSNNMDAQNLAYYMKKVDFERKCYCWG